MKRQDIEKYINVWNVDVPITKIATKNEAYKMAFADNYCFSNKIDGETVVQEDCSVWALLKDGTEIGASDGEPIEGRIPKQAEIAALIMGDTNGNYFWNEDMVNICLEYDEHDELINFTLLFNNYEPCYKHTMTTFAELA